MKMRRINVHKVHQSIEAADDGSSQRSVFARGDSFCNRCLGTRLHSGREGQHCIKVRGVMQSNRTEAPRISKCSEW
jgi:hypothetical protein